MGKEDISPQKFDAAIRGLLAVPKESIQQTVKKTLTEKKERTKQKIKTKKG